MLRSIARIGVLVAVVSGWACAGPPPTRVSNNAPQPGAPAPSSVPLPPMPANGAGGGQTGGQVNFKAPEGWVQETPASSMRLAQYRLPRASGDAEDGSLVVFYFGAGQGGSVQANLDRWVNQMQQPDGSSSQSRAKTETLQVNGMQATVLDVSGTYTAEMNPGAGDNQNKPGYRMQAAVVETPRGPYFVKFVGPEKTVARWESSFIAFLNSFEAK